MMKSTLIAFLGITLFDIIGARPHCTYIFYYQPVCGSDGKTYINSGHLTCEKFKYEGLEMISVGQCPPGTVPHATDNGRQDWNGMSSGLSTAPQAIHPELAFNNEETQPGNAFVNAGHIRTGQMLQGQGNYPGDGVRWDNSREYPDNSFELHIGGGHKGGGMAKGIIAGAVLGKVASDFSKNKHDKQKLGTAGMGSNPYQPQPNPYAQQPNPYAQQPNPYAQQPKPYAVQPNPYQQQPNPYGHQPNPYAPSNPTNPNSRPSAYNPSAPSAPAAPAKAVSTGTGNSGTNTNTGNSNSGRSRTSSKKSGRKSGGRKGRSVA